MTEVDNDNITLKIIFQMAEEIVIVPLTKVIFDLLLLQLVVWPIFILRRWANPSHRGFYCDDNSIRHPFVRSTMPSWSVYASGFVLNIITMILTEIINRPNDRRTFYFLGRNVPYWVYSAYCAIGIFAFGAACVRLTTDVMKYPVGRLRPHFYTVCQPSINCTLASNQHIYHMAYTCTNNLFNKNKGIMKGVRVSFPSGHSSVSMYTMMYFAIYLQKRMTWDGSKLLRHTLQFLAVLFSIFIAMTRISDYKHHGSDVLAGLSIGTIGAVVVARFFATLFSRKSEPNSSEHSELNNRTTAI